MWAFTLYYWALGQQHSLVKGTHVPRVYATACMCAHWRVLCKRSSFILMHTQEEFLPEAALHQSWWCSKWHIVAVFFFFVTYYILSSCLSGVAELFYFFIFWSIFADLLMCNVGYLCNTSYVILLASFLQRIDHRWSFVSWKFGCNVVHTNTECIYVFFNYEPREAVPLYSQQIFKHMFTLCKDFMSWHFTKEFLNIN